MKVAIYLRVSTERQDAAAQLPALLQLCAARGWAPTVVEETESGAKARPHLEALCERARRGEFPVLVVWALDRLGRDLWETIARVRALWAAGVQVVSLQDAWIEGAAGPVRDLLLMLLAWVASFERQRLRERTHIGLAKARAAGRVGGRPKKDAQLAAAAAECRQVEGTRFNAGSLVWVGAQPGERVGRVAARHGVGESSLRRYLRQHAAELLKKGAPEPARPPLGKRRDGHR